MFTKENASCPVGRKLLQREVLELYGIIGSTDGVLIRGRFGSQVAFQTEGIAPSPFCSGGGLPRPLNY